ncbi:SDR family NAD(P)-dependent oxidoreductase [Anaerolineales bacterium]
MGNKWTTENIPDLHHKVIVITGANSGIGFEAARAFAQKGAIVILACRNMQKAQEATTRILEDNPDAILDIMPLDLAEQASVKAFSGAFHKKYDRLDILLNNAGIMAVPYAKTVDGFEQQFATNHLGHFALTGLLMDRLLETPQSRVVNISSNAHRWGEIDFDNLMYENGEGYKSFSAYGRSKLANLLFTLALQKRFEAIGSDSLALAAHPGGSNTNLADHFKDHWYGGLVSGVLSIMMQNAAMGALPGIRAAVDPNVKGGEYFGPDGFKEQRGYPVEVKTSERAQDEALAERLWQASEVLTGIHYEALENARDAVTI